MNAQGVFYEYVTYGSGKKWIQQLQPRSFKHVELSSDNVYYAVATDGTVWSRILPGSWYQLPGGLKQISAGTSKHVWGVNNNNEIYKLTGNSWTKFPGKLSQISVNRVGNVWGINSSNEIYFRNNSDPKKPWERITTGLGRSIAAGPWASPHIPANVWLVGRGDTSIYSMWPLSNN